MRLNNNELAEIYQNGKWIPICGHWFWNNNKGATLFCQQLGQKTGIVKQESIAGQVPLPDDGFRIGECKTNDIWGQCTGGCNDHTIGGTLCGDCRSGAMAGLRIECSGNHYRLYVLTRRFFPSHTFLVHVKSKFSIINLAYLVQLHTKSFYKEPLTPVATPHF